MRTTLFSLFTIFIMAIGSQVQAALLKFDTSSDLTTNWSLDVFPGDATTQWRPGYAPSGGFDGSDGGFVHFNSYFSSNSMQYIAGDFFLGSLEVSSQYAGGGNGVSNAALSGHDFRMVLYDSALNVLSDSTYFTDPGGAWTTIILNVANVRTIWVDSPYGGGEGFWPNFDNILINEVASESNGVPAPGALLLLGFGLLGLGLQRTRTA